VTSLHIASLINQISINPDILYLLLKLKYYHISQVLWKFSARYVVFALLCHWKH